MKICCASVSLCGSVCGPRARTISPSPELGTEKEAAPASRHLPSFDIGEHTPGQPLVEEETENGTEPKKRKRKRKKNGKRKKKRKSRKRDGASADEPPPAPVITAQLTVLSPNRAASTVSSRATEYVILN
jgi:hypothetical protein